MGGTVAIEGRSGGVLPRLRLMRLPNAVTAVADVIAGGALAGVSPGRLAPLALAAALVYAGGCVLNDLADRELDLTKHPHRPLPTGVVSSKEAGLLATFLLAAGSGSAAIAGVVPAAAAALLVLLVLLYDLGGKRHPLPGPLLMGSCRAAAVLLGMSPASPPPAAAFLFPAATFLFVFALTRLARFEKSGAPPRGGIAAPAFGAFVLLSAGVLLLPRVHPAPGAAFLLLFALVAGAGVTRGLRGGGEGTVAAAVGMLILSIPLLEAVAAASAVGWGAGAAAAACALPPWLARNRFYLT